ncbi:unnamed protein product [Lasius platythorax]|uniref:DUF4806 domain-containing protein n=1 Tax=Lasius platythorax TaxID=488582 RepID=A0AAV2NFM3_9HYME
MDCGEITKKYAVVKFLLDNLYSEIPTSWLTRENNKQLCWWPPRTANTKILIVNCASPNFDTWNKYEVDVIKYCTSLESARKNAADSNYETTDEDGLGRGRRQHISYNKFSSEDEVSDVPARSCKTYTKRAINTNKVSAIPSCPDGLTFSNDMCNNNEGEKNKNDTENDFQYSQSYEKGKTSCTSFEPSKKIQICNISNVPIIFEGAASSEGRGLLEDSNMKIKYLKQIIRTQATSNLILEDIKQRIGRIEDVMRNRASVLTNNRNDNLIAQMLPLDTVEAIRNFDLLLHNTNEAVTQFKEFLLRVGGHHPRDNIYRILSKIFTNACAINCSWKGIRNNFKIADLYFIKIMKREITFQHSNFTEAEFDYIVAEWLRFAKQRKRREEMSQGRNVEEINEQENN